MVLAEAMDRFESSVSTDLPPSDKIIFHSRIDQKGILTGDLF